MTGISRGRRLRRWIFWITGGLALLLVGGFAFLIAVGMHARAKNPSARELAVMDSSTATEPVTVTMGQVVLRIPRNYFLSLPVHDIQGKPDGIEFVLLGLMPSFEPRTEANNAEISDFHGFGRKLNVLVSYKGYTRTGRDLFQIFYNGKARRPETGELYSDRGPVTDVEFGYHSFSTGGFDRLFLGTADDPKDFIRCRPKDPGGPPIAPPEKPFLYFPSCERTILVGEDIVVQFTFSRDYLGSAHDIEQQAIGVLNRFRISGPPLEVIQ